MINKSLIWLGKKCDKASKMYTRVWRDAVLFPYQMRQNEKGKKLYTKSVLLYNVTFSMKQIFSQKIVLISLEPDKKSFFSWSGSKEL